MNSLELAKEWYAGGSGDNDPEMDDMRIRGLAEQIDKHFIPRANVTSYFVEGICSVCGGDVGCSNFEQLIDDFFMNAAEDAVPWIYDDEQ